MELTSAQKQAVHQLTEHYKLVRQNHLSGSYKNVYFKAPTGSGKTFMASKLIANILDYENLTLNNKTIIIVATVSNADLPKQFANKLKEYQKYNLFNQYQIEHIQSPSVTKSNKREDYKGFHLANNKVFVLGTSSFGKHTIFYQNNVLDNLIKECEINGYKIVFIRDEAHIGSRERIGKAELKRFDDYMEHNARFILRMTATPPLSNNKLVEITTDDLMNDDNDRRLLKDEPKRPFIQSNFSGQDISDSDVLSQAIAKFKDLKTQYQKLNCQPMVRPAILIQIDNDSNKNPKIRQDYEEGLKLIENTLQKHHLTYLKYLDKKIVVGTNCSDSLSYASQNDSLLDAIIFKIGPATGWDIPRANMLIQLRSVSSETLSIQTIGRIMRNPFPGLEYNEITSQCFLYSNYKKPTGTIAYYERKKKFQNKLLYRGQLNDHSEDFYEDTEQYKVMVRKKYIYTNTFINKIKDLNIEEDIVKVKTIINDTEVSNRRIVNYIHLKIENERTWYEYERSLHLSNFLSDLKAISEEYNVNLEIVKNLFLKDTNKLGEFKNECTTFHQKLDNYWLQHKARLKAQYNIWISDKDKYSDFSLFNNYGYNRVTNDDLEKDKQYLDSEPEARFMKLISQRPCIKSNFDKVKFYAKMPVFGSGVFFQYYYQAKILRSYIDFVIEMNDVMLMVEVKSHNNDYDPNKTKALKIAYRNYMNQHYKMGRKQEGASDIILAIYAYDSRRNTNYIHYYDRDEERWKENNPFSEAIDKIFNH